MKQGLSLTNFALQLERENKAKRDFIISAPKISAYAVDGELEMAFALKEQPKSDNDYFAGKLVQTGHEQMASFLNIPKAYYDRMNTTASVELLAKNTQHWLNMQSDRRMIRTLDGNVRGILSDRYRRLDNYDLMTAMLPILMDAKADIVTCEITDRKLYIKFLTHQMEGEVQKGDIVTLGGIISNSEVGFGALSVQPLILRKVCNNGLIVNDLAYRKYHVGRKSKEETIDITFSDDTNTAIDKAFWLQTRDVIKETVSQITMDKALNLMRASAGLPIKDAQVAMEITSQKIGLNQDESTSVLTHLINGGDLSSWGMLNAVTRAAQDVESFDRSIELETLASQLLTMNLNRN
jgi:hypothetical protein